MMKFLNRIWSSIAAFFQRPTGRRGAGPERLPADAVKPQPTYSARFFDDDANLPSTLDAAPVYIIGSSGNEWLAVMLCPCGCKSKISLNLLSEEKPRWKWHVDSRAAVTLQPSVWRDIGCKSHFILRNGHVDWVVD